MSAKRGSSRRDFLKNCLLGASVLGAGGELLASAADQTAVPANSKVVIAHDAMLRGASRGTGATVDSQRVLALLDRAMQSLFDRDQPLEPWKKLVRPGERVALKVNALGGHYFSTNTQLVEAICQRLQEAGVKPADIIVWDRDSDELRRAGYQIATDGNRVQCFGTDHLDYEPELATYGSVGSRLSRILTQRCDVLINVPVLKDHDGAGVSIALKNMYGVIHNPNKLHPNGCNPFVADLNMLPQIKTKMRLTICDATTAGYDGGPGYKPAGSWKPDSLIVSQDPVALDYTGWQIIERKRAERGLKSLDAEKRLPQYIATAADAQHRLGTNDPKRITLVEV